jgi:16S rRNA (guanine966-N2)-methyltransferase
VRIISGIYGGRRLQAQVADATRPTSDRVREALGSALQSRAAFDAAVVLDLFAGTGALGLEALSRGASQVLAVEHDRDALRCIEDNVRALGVQAQVSVLKLDLHKQADVCLERLRATGLGPFTLIFADPPYADLAELLPLLAALAASELCAPRALFAVEHQRAAQPAAPAGLEIVGSYRYGDTAITLLARPV